MRAVVVIHTGTQTPTRAEVLAAAGKTIPDVIAPRLDVLFIGINPGLYSAAVGHHFARPGNRFWPALYKAGITPRLLTPTEDSDLLTLGLGITDVVSRATAAAAELSPNELAQGGLALIEKVERYRPHKLAFLGVGAYRITFALPQAVLGRQPGTIAGSTVFVLPNPSGINAHYPLDDLAVLFRVMWESEA